VTREIGRVPQALWSETPGNVFRTDLTLERLGELDRLRENAVEFREICRINYGAQISSKEKGAFGRERYLARSDEGMDDPRKFYEGSNMRPYGMDYDGFWVDMGRRAEMYGPRKRELFERPKLSVRHISGDFDSFVAWVDEDHYYTDHGVIHAVPYFELAGAYRVTQTQVDVSRHYPLFFLLGVLMSRPASQLYAELYATGSLQGAFSHVYPNMVKGLPIPKLESLPAEAPKDWFERLSEQVVRGHLSRSGVRRALGGRLQAAAALEAAARRRQAVELRRGRRRADFLAFMRVQEPSWRWRRNESLENPPDETAFLQTVGTNLISLDLMEAVRKEFRHSVAAAAADVLEAETLQGFIDALAGALYAGA
jgi:hypothetical protein